VSFIKSLYFTNRLFIILIAIALLFVVSFIFSWLFPIVKLILLASGIIAVVDIFILYKQGQRIEGKRIIGDKLSNGDNNEVKIGVTNNSNFDLTLYIIDELPEQFQKRNFLYKVKTPAGATKTLSYFLRPVKRGEYNFGALNVFAISKIGIAKRKYRFDQDKTIPVYPAFLQMRKYELMAISNNLINSGIKKIRKIGHNFEFEQIKEYVPGDDYRTLNWKATARKGELMVNSYQDEKSQQVYALIDKGRAMRMPFEGLTLLDYAINASLVISNIAIKKEDKAGLITFQHKVNALVPASKQSKQMQLIMEVLYKEKTAYKESDYASLYATIKRKINQRSLLLLFTNFESLSSLERQLFYLKKMAKDHLVVVVFFENTELKALINKETSSVEEIYYQTIAEKFEFEKKLIVKELNKHGIQAVLTPPQRLTVNTINKYLELKARGLI
jgi:uncharacterized protein (DUF58 family)